MKHLIFLVFILLFACIESFAQELNPKELEDIRLKQIENIKNPSLWDIERMNQDVVPDSDILPIRKGAFPVPHYKL